MDEVGVPEKYKKKIRDHIAAIHILKENGLKGSSVIGAYHARRVAPLMTRALPLYAMAPEASFDGTALPKGALPNSEIVQQIKEAMEPSWDDVGAPLISSSRCRDILRCGRNQDTSSS